MSSLGWVSSNKFNLSLHVSWGEDELLVEVRPELLVVWLGGGSVELEGVKSEVLPDLLGVSVSWVVLGIIKLSSIESDENVSNISTMSCDEVMMSLDSSRVNLFSSNSVL